MKKITENFAVVLLFFSGSCLFVVATHAQSRIVKTDGTVYEGKIVNESPAQVELVTADSTHLTVLRNSIRSIEYDNVPAVPPGGFNVYGGTFGTPAGLNAIYGRYYTNFGFRLSGMFWGQSLMGVQIDGLYNLYRSRTFSHNISLMFGTAQIAHSIIQNNTLTTSGYDNFTYFGAGYDLNWSNFFFGLGYGVGAGLLLQIGYVYEAR